MSSLTFFIYDYIKKLVNTPQSSNWLPNVLKEYELKKNNLEIELSEEQSTSLSSSIVLTFGLIVNKILGSDEEFQDILNQVVFCEDQTNKDPKLSIPSLTILGLENSKLMPLMNISKDDKNDKFEFNVPLYGPEYDTSKFPDIRPFNIIVDFIIEQHIGAYLREQYQSKGEYILAEDIHPQKKFDHGWPRFIVTLKGKLIVTLKEQSKDSLNEKSSYPLEIKSLINLLYAENNCGNERKIILNIQSVDILDGIKKSSPFSFKMDSLTSEEYSNQAASFEHGLIFFFKCPDSLLQILKKVENILNIPSMLDDMSKKMTKFTAEQIDKVLGVVDGELPTTVQKEPNAVDQYIFDRIRYAICSENSDFSLQKMIEKSTDPVLDPWNIGQINVEELKVIVDNVIINGLKQQKISTDDIGFIYVPNEEHDRITFNTKLNLDITGDITSLYEEHVDNCSFKITLTENPFFLKCIISGETLEDFSFEIEDVIIIFKENSINITIEAEGSQFAPIIQNILNKHIEIILQKINNKLPEYKQKISNYVTQRIKQLLENASKTEE